MISPFRRKRNSRRPERSRFCMSESIAAPFLLCEELVDLFSQLPPKDEQRAFPPLAEDALTVPPYQLYNLSVGDPPLRDRSMSVADEREDRACKFRLFVLVDAGASHL